VVRTAYAKLPAAVVMPGSSEVLASARAELLRGTQGLLNRTLRVEAALPKEPAFVLGTQEQLRALGLAQEPALAEDAFAIRVLQGHYVITAANDRGVLYGVFALLRKLALRQPLAQLPGRETPYANTRWVNEWDNLDGTIERGYGGPSLWFANNNVKEDLTATGEYARLLASVGIHAVAVNNVNANPRVVATEFLPQLARLAAAFRAWGVRIAVSIDFSSPQKIGGLATFDPLDPAVVSWWNHKIGELYQAVPDLAGIVIKADSEGRLGPSAYKRSHADAANVIARPLQAHHGVIFYRGFVYDHHMDWRNLKNDRARAAWDNFHQLDGAFEPNVILQIKHGPIDFQVREPASPLFGALEKTSQAIELQITQEYFGQARHMVWLVPMWKAALDFDMQAKGAGTPVKALVAGKTFQRPMGGFVGVSCVGSDVNWYGHDLSQANLYGYGRLAWNPDLSAAQIADEWTRLTFGHHPKVVSTVAAMQLRSWQVFENYTGPLGAQTLTEITGNHYGPAVEASERNGWGQWHRADEKGIGMDRTVATGTGFIGQYRPAVAKVYESLQLCPDELLLFMHHVPYTHVLKSGKTVIQHIYDTHYLGATQAEEYVREWRSLSGLVDEPRYRAILAKLEYQAGHVQVWRDAINGWFFKTSQIADRQGRVGNHPGRYEAEALQLGGYTALKPARFEAASGETAIECRQERCTATLAFQGKPGWYRVDVQYFDQVNGQARYRLVLNAQTVDAWTADDRIPSPRIDAHTSMRRRLEALALRPGDRLVIEGFPNAGDRAGLDYVELKPLQ